MNNYATKNLSTKQSPPRQETRLPRTYGDQERSRSFETPSREGTQEINGSSLLSFRLPKTARVRKPAEFRRIYSEGKRFEGRFMTVFIAPSDAGVQRLGITASKKAVGNAVARNRAKRLLREAFRLSRAELDELDRKFDWVLNARRNLLTVKLEKPLKEFREIVGRVKIFESKSKTGEENVESR